MSHNIIKALKPKTLRYLVETGIIHSKENKTRSEMGRVIKPISTQQIMDLGENAIIEVSRLKKEGKSNEEIKAQIDSYMEELGLHIFEQYKYQQSLFYSLADSAYKQIGQLAPTSA